jgi:hypothetical protein
VTQDNGLSDVSESPAEAVWQKCQKFQNFKTPSNFAKSPVCYIDIPTASSFVSSLLSISAFVLRSCCRCCRIITFVNVNAPPHLPTFHLDSIDLTFSYIVHDKVSLSKLWLFSLLGPLGCAVYPMLAVPSFFLAKYRFHPFAVVFVNYFEPPCRPFLPLYHHPLVYLLHP